MAVPLAPTRNAGSLTHRALYEEVAELLRQRITKRELEPGSWIDELKIAEELGISRTLREAIKVLATEGLVTMKVRRGAYVAEMSPADLADVYHLLGLLESDAAGIAATRASETELQELLKLHQELAGAAEPGTGNADLFFAINERFHTRLLEIANNRWRNQIVTDLRKLMKLNRHNSLLKTGRIPQSLQEHAAIVDALRQRDAQRAAECMRRHFDQGLKPPAPAPGKRHNAKNVF